MNIWMIGKNSIKFCYLKRKFFTVTWKILLMQITHMQKEFVKISKQKIKLELDTAHVLTAPVLA